jgi:hypothetical protein
MLRMRDTGGCVVGCMHADGDPTSLKAVWWDGRAKSGGWCFTCGKLDDVLKRIS